MDKLSKKVATLLGTLDFDAQSFSYYLSLAGGSGRDILQNRLFDVFVGLMYRWASLYDQGLTPPGHRMHRQCSLAKDWIAQLES